MSSLKKALKKVTKGITGVDPDAARRAEEDAKRQQEEAAKLAAEQSQVETGLTTGQGESDAVDPTQAVSTKKKKLATGRKSLAISRASGSGINV